jgi:hypothetical protein
LWDYRPNNVANIWYKTLLFSHANVSKFADPISFSWSYWRIRNKALDPLIRANSLSLWRNAVIDYHEARDMYYDVTRLSLEERGDFVQIINSTLSIKASGNPNTTLFIISTQRFRIL